MTNLSKLGLFRVQTFNKLVQMIWNDPRVLLVDSMIFIQSVKPHATYT